MNNITLLHGDCLKLMKDIPDRSVDLILTDPPYETTSCTWDKALPMNQLWEHYKRIIKNNCVIVIFGKELFASRVRLSNPEWYKYDWIWQKTTPVGFTNAKLKPLNNYENIMVFSEGCTANGSKNNMPYYPQGLIEINKTYKQNVESQLGKENTYHRKSWQPTYTQTYTNYPKTILTYPTDKEKYHPTQKPVALLEYLINTYTQTDAIVLDNCMGSGSTGIAAINTGRDFIGIEKDDKYFNIAEERINNHKPTKECDSLG